jgi:ribosomal protein S18 acetylase RimI-like enzyme
VHRHLIDPLLAPVVPLDPDAGEILGEGVIPADGAAIGQAGYIEREETDPLALWGRLRTHVLRIRLGGGDVRAALEALVDAWVASIDPATVEPGDPDSSLSITVPSRDVRYVGVLQHRHFSPAANLSVRVERHGAASAVVPVSAAGGAVRTATEDDVPVLGGMALELQRYDAAVGSLSVRDGALATLTNGIADQRRDEPGLTWVFEDDQGVVRGFTQLDSPEQGSWASAPYVDPGRAAYLSYQYVDPAARGRGIGSALIQAAHAEAARRGWSAIVLHHASANPLSSVFWPRHGYRPLMTTWFRCPALLAGA